MHKTDLDFEIKRKIFHLCSLVFPITYFFLEKIYMIIVLTLITGATLYLDISRHYDIKIKGFIKKIFDEILRSHEDGNRLVLSGASYMALGFLSTCLFFSKGLAITAWLVLIISDCFAALIGRRYGSPLFNSKSYAGSVSFFLSSVLVSILTYFSIGYNTSFYIILMSSFVTTVMEFFSGDIKINDNLSIPLTYAFVTFFFSLMA